LSRYSAERASYEGNCDLAAAVTVRVRPDWRKSEGVHGGTGGEMAVAGETEVKRQAGEVRGAGKLSRARASR